MIPRGIVIVKRRWNTIRTIFMQNALAALGHKPTGGFVNIEPSQITEYKGRDSWRDGRFDLGDLWYINTREKIEAGEGIHTEDSEATLKDIRTGLLAVSLYTVPFGPHPVRLVPTAISMMISGDLWIDARLEEAYADD